MFYITRYILVLGLAAAAVSAAQYYKMLRQIGVTDEVMARSYANITEVPDISFCSWLCEGDPGCVDALYEEENQLCVKFNCTLDDGPTNVNSTITLMKQTQNEGVEPAKCFPPYTDCQEAFEAGDIRHGEVYTLKPSESWGQMVKAVCHFDSSNGWTVIQSRLDGSVDFYRGWDEYVAGFGDPEGEYWLGLDAIYYLTQTNRIASIYMDDWEGVSAFANYTSFFTDGPEAQYTIHFGGYSGDNPNSFTYDNNKPFSTHDRDTSNKHAVTYHGAWWYGGYTDCNLNGLYVTGGESSGNVMFWLAWRTWRRRDYSLKTVYMRVSR